MAFPKPDCRACMHSMICLAKAAAICEAYPPGTVLDEDLFCDVLEHCKRRTAYLGLTEPDCGHCPVGVQWKQSKGSTECPVRWEWDQDHPAPRDEAQDACPH